MADISEAEAILHLKRALGEIDASDAVPPPLPKLQPKPAPPKVPKTAPTQAAKSAPAAPPSITASIGPTPRNEQLTRAPTPSAPKPGPPPMRPQLRPPIPMGAQGAQLGGFLTQQFDAQKEPPMAAGLAGLGMRPPGMPPGLQPPGLGGPRPPGSGAPGGLPGMPGLPGATAPPAASAPPKPQGVQFTISQAKVALVIGKNASTINAIKTYSKAQCFIEERTPDEDKAQVTVVGSASEMQKCKQCVLAVVDGTMSIATLCSLAGVSMPKGGGEEWEGKSLPASLRAGGAGAGAGPPGFPPHLGAHGPAPPFGTMPPFPFPPGAGVPGAHGVPGMPQNSAMQQNLNDYYARWWSTYAQGQRDGDTPDGQQAAAADGGGPAPMAFDKEALAKLAERAAKGEVPEPTPEPPAPANDQAALADSAMAGLPGMPSMPPGPPPPPGGASPLEKTGTFSSFQMPPTATSSTAPTAGGLLGQTARGPITLKGFLRPSEPVKSKKDDDSVQKMMERLQGNVEQTKEAISMSQVVPPRPQMARPMGSFGQEDDGRTQADHQFEALMSRMQASSTQEDVEHMSREVLIRFGSFTPQQVTDLMQKADGAPGLQSGNLADLLAEFARGVIGRLKEFSSPQFTSLVSTVAAWSRKPDRKREGRFQEFTKAFFNAASMEMSSRLMTFAPHELNCCLAAFVSIGFSEHKFFASVGRAALARHSSFAPVQLTALLAILSEMRLVHTDLFNAAALFLTARVKELRPVDIIRVLRSFAKCAVQHQGLCKAVADEVVSRYRDKSATFKAEDLCEIGWALCVLQQYHEPLIRVMFKGLEKSPTIASDSLCQIYECHLVLDSEFKEAYSKYRIDRDLVDALEDHYKENRKDERRCSERQRNDVASVLKSLVDGSVHVNHRTSSGLLVDVAALRKRSSTDGFIHVDLDSNVTVVRSLDQDELSSAALVTEGPVAMRRRLLQKSGLRLVTVRESEWRELDDSKDKRRYLRSLLSNLGDVLQ